MSLTLRDNGEFYDDEEDFDNDDEPYEEWYEESGEDDRICDACGAVFEDCDCEYGYPDWE